jgi:hypothetical protein
VLDEWHNMNRWWSDNDKGKPKYSGKNSTAKPLSATIPYGPGWDGARTSDKTEQRLTASGLARLDSCYCCLSCTLYGTLLKASWNCKELIWNLSSLPLIFIGNNSIYHPHISYNGKAIPLQTKTDRWGSRRLRLPELLDNRYMNGITVTIWGAIPPWM